MRTCPGCRTPMNEISVQAVKVDSCPKCAGVFLDADEGGVINVDTGKLFGFGARPAGISKRLCPDHNAAMMTFSVGTPSGDVAIERAQCCGGVYLDAGEGFSIAQGNASPPSASHGNHANTARGPSCPACADALTQRVFHEVNVDECIACASFFLEAGEAELAGIDSEALFVDAAWAAPKAGPSELSCPKCRTAMALYRPAILGPSVDVHVAECCRGIWMKRSDEDYVRAASRVAVSKRADAQYAAGDEVQLTAASRTQEEIAKGRAISARQSANIARYNQEISFLASIRSYQNR